MGSCNVPQKEVGGKQLLVKICKDMVGATTDASTTLTITGHGAKPGDLVIFKTKGALTVVQVDKPYIVLATPTDNTMTITAAPGGTAIEFDATEATLDIDVFRNFGGIRSKSFSLSAGIINVTNQDSDEWQKILDGAGVRSFSVSGSGVYTNEATFQEARAAAIANQLVCMAFVDISVFDVTWGCMKIESLEVSGEYDGEATYSISAQSSGAVNVQKLAV